MSFLKQFRVWNLHFTFHSSLAYPTIVNVNWNVYVIAHNETREQLQENWIKQIIINFDCHATF